MTALSNLAALQREADAGEEAPRPLRRPIRGAVSFPSNVLPDRLADGAESIEVISQAPSAIAAQASVAVAALAVQPHLDAISPTGRRSPCSIYAVTVAESGERKTTDDELACEGVRQVEDRLALDCAARRNEFDARLAAWERQRSDELKMNDTFEGRTAALLALGPAPTPPAPPLIRCPDPTLEGLHRLFAEGRTFAGLFSSEGGSLIGGVAMSADSRLRTAAGLSDLWGGEPIRRVRAGDGVRYLRGRRLSLHLGLQPGAVAGNLLGDRLLHDQGLISRLLIVAPDPTAGSRIYRQAPTSARRRLARFKGRVVDLLERDPHTLAGDDCALDPRPVELDPAARELWVKFIDATERQLASDGKLASIRAFGSKLGEHALRLAVVIAGFERDDPGEVTAEDLARAIKLATYYADEALRLHENATDDPDLILAERVLAWLSMEGLHAVSLPTLYQRGPNRIRDAKTARRIVGVLEQHGWLRRLPDGLEEDGVHRRDAWEMVRPC